jgi:hypothetical protein
MVTVILSTTIVFFIQLALVIAQEIENRSIRSKVIEIMPKALFFYQKIGLQQANITKLGMNVVIIGTHVHAKNRAK